MQKTGQLSINGIIVHNICMIKSALPTVQHLQFRPIFGLGSPHIQTVLSILFSKPGFEPPSVWFQVSLDDGDILHCMLSTPPTWTPSGKTILLVHGLGGSHSSSYMVRLSWKLYQKGFRILRINLRGVGPGEPRVQRPYHGGVSQDLLQVVQALKKQSPDSPFIMIGFSLGGNIALKLAGELGSQAGTLLEEVISVCAPIDLAQTMNALLSFPNRLYSEYYVNGLKKLGNRWLGAKSIRTIIDFDHAVTAPQWGFKDAFDYYKQSSSCFLLPKISLPCHLIFAADDPFIDYRSALMNSLPTTTKVSLSPYGGHMGFLGWSGEEHGYFWLDHLLLSFLK